MKAILSKPSKLGKRLICLCLVLVNVLTPTTSVLPDTTIWGIEMTAEAKSRDKSETYTVYYKKYTGESVSLTDALDDIGVDSTYSHRKLIAKTNGIEDYTGTAKQNDKLLDLLKSGKLKDTWKMKVFYKDEMKVDKTQTITIKAKGNELYAVGTMIADGENVITLSKPTKTKDDSWYIFEYTVKGIAEGSAGIAVAMKGTLGTNKQIEGIPIAFSVKK